MPAEALYLPRWQTEGYPSEFEFELLDSLGLV